MNHVTNAPLTLAMAFSCFFCNMPSNNQSNDTLVQDDMFPLYRLENIDLAKVDFNKRESVGRKRLQELIDDLQTVSQPTYGLGVCKGHDHCPFAPIGEELWINIPRYNWQSKVETHGSIKELVQIGAEALPLLLDSLTDARPTKLVLKTETKLYFDHRVRAGNHLNRREQKTLDYLPSNPKTPQTIKSYTVKVGDVCFVILGQILGRRYWVVDAYQYPDLHICSPVVDRELQTNLANTWSSANPQQLLFDSLILDFCTRGGFNGKMLRGYYPATDLQANAIVRLLFYYPQQATQLVLDRFQSLDVTKREQPFDFSRLAKNGARSYILVASAAWSENPRVKTIIDELQDKATDTSVSGLFNEEFKSTQQVTNCFN